MDFKTSFHVVIVAISCCGWLTQATSVPTWPNCYYASGSIQLPYVEINEPFKVYFEGKRNRSRIDYYDLVETYQIGVTTGKPYGVSYKVAYMSTEEVLNVKTCFQVDGTAKDPVSPQTIFPDMTGFELKGNKSLEGIKCNVWEKVEMIGKKKNTYTLYENIHSNLPVRYEMIGYDTLLGSHYDRYYIVYKDIMVQENLPDSVFDINKNMTCRGFPGPGVNDLHRHDHYHMNPIKEFCQHDETHVHSMFESFKKNHSKVYENTNDEMTRLNNFKHNVRYINSKNRAGLSYQMAVNFYADMHDHEIRTTRGRKYRQGYMGYNGGLPFNASEFQFQEIPAEIDWRLRGAVTQVKDQAVCGSCWSFGTTGTLEGAYFLKTGNLVRLSQQELVDCSWGEGNNGCDGGEDFRAYQFIMKNGLTSEEVYGPYLGVDGKCHKPADAIVMMKNYVNVTSGDAKALKAAIAVKGPVSVSIDAAHKSLSFYSSGVYYEPECGNTLESLDHSVLAVGYGTLDGQDYWLIKNSWSTYWGNDGYVLISQKDNNCGVTTAPTYVIL